MLLNELQLLPIDLCNHCHLTVLLWCEMQVQSAGSDFLPNKQSNKFSICQCFALFMAAPN